MNIRKIVTTILLITLMSAGLSTNLKARYFPNNVNFMSLLVIPASAVSIVIGCALGYKTYSAYDCKAELTCSCPCCPNKHWLASFYKNRAASIALATLLSAPGIYGVYSVLRAGRYS